MAKQVPVTIYRGQTVNGSCELRLIDTLIPGLQSPYLIPSGALVEMLWPGTGGVSVILDNTGSEVTINTQNRAKISFAMPPAKSLLLLVDSSTPPANPITVNVRVTDNTPSPAVVNIFQKAAVYFVVDKANP